MTGKTTKVALITGANRGIGLETARQLGRLGITVLVGARELAKAERTSVELRGEGIDARAVKLDMLDRADYAAAAAMIEKEFGRLDILINNAGIMLDKGAKNETSTTSQALLRETFDTNFFAVVELTQVMLPLVRKSPAGRIVNLSSILASQTLHATKGSAIYDAKHLAYDASKVAVNAFTIHLAHELKETKIKVNSADPGWVKTDMGGEGARMEIKDGAKTSVALATLGEDGPTGGYFHMGKAQPW
jgi:NAD(P)-dependent dehydrogenase (short-subunit alcohol dehydrogenase family)